MGLSERRQGIVTIGQFFVPGDSERKYTLNMAKTLLVRVVDRDRMFFLTRQLLCNTAEIVEQTKRALGTRSASKSTSAANVVRC